MQFEIIIHYKTKTNKLSNRPHWQVILIINLLKNL